MGKDKEVFCYCKSFINNDVASLTRVSCNIIISLYDSMISKKGNDMTKSEFIDKLVFCLTGKVSTGTIQENVAYYEQYFLNEMRVGKSEDEIADSLGSPQLIAKGIIEAERFQSGHAQEGEYNNRVDEEKDYRSRGMLILVVLLFFFGINIAITVFSALAPIIIPICIVLFIMHIFKNNL